MLVAKKDNRSKFGFIFSILGLVVGLISGGLALFLSIGMFFFASSSIMVSAMALLLAVFFVLCGIGIYLLLEPKNASNKNKFLALILFVIVIQPCIMFVHHQITPIIANNRARNSINFTDQYYINLKMNENDLYYDVEIGIGIKRGLATEETRGLNRFEVRAYLYDDHGNLFIILRDNIVLEPESSEVFTLTAPFKYQWEAMCSILERGTRLNLKRISFKSVGRVTFIKEANPNIRTEEVITKDNAICGGWEATELQFDL